MKKTNRALKNGRPVVEVVHMKAALKATLALAALLVIFVGPLISLADQVGL